MLDSDSHDFHFFLHHQGSKIALVRSYLRVPKAAGQVKILKLLMKIKIYPYMPIIFVMQGKCLFSDISRPDHVSLILPAGFGQSTFSTDPWWQFEGLCVMFSKRYTLASFRLSIGIHR